MKKGFVWFIFVLFSLLLLFGCGSFRKKAESEKGKKTGNIAGIVFDVQTMQPLSGANVYAEGMTRGTKTDTLGRFWLSAVPIGKYNIRVEKIYYHSGEIREVKVYTDSTSIVSSRLIINAIEPWGYMIDWDGRIIKTDSISFFSTQYKNLLRKE